MAVEKTVNDGKEAGGVFLRVSKHEFLIYKVVVKGASPIFALVDEENRLLMSEADAPSPQMEYTRKWPTNPPDFPLRINYQHSLGMSFLAAIQYTYIVEHHLQNGSVEELINIDYVSQEPEDDFFQDLGVTTA